MPAKHDYPEDLFEGTKMTFGEHLEELRKCFFRALVGLIIAFVVTLIFKWADKVITFIQTPLKASLETFHIEKAAADAGNLVERMTKAGLDAPDAAAIEDTIRGERFLPTLYYVNPRDVSSIANPGKSQAAEETEAGMTAITLWRPVADDPRIAVTSLSPHEMFMIWMKAAILVSVVVASPWIFYQVWNFVAAGLYPHEKRYVHIYMPFSIGLFLSGAALCFFFVFEPVLDFLFTFNKAMQVDPDMRISEWFGFAIFLPLGFGVAFQLPLVMLFLERIGVFSVGVYLSKWRISILVIFVISMILTPADPYSMLFLAVPLTFLYFGGIALCRVLPKNRNPFGAVEEV